MRSLITGGAGFIGSHLTEYLLNEGDEVIVLDDLSTGQLKNLDAVLRNPALELHVGSILDERLVRRLVRRSDRVFHLAAAVGVHTIVDHPLSSLRTNLHGTEVVLDAAVTFKRPVLLASTSEVYGKNTADSLDEQADRILGSPLLSRWTYAAAKGLDEAIAYAHHVESGLPIRIVRLFNTVGARQSGRYGMVVPTLVAQAIADEPLTVYGDGNQSRCFSYVGDIVPALVALAAHPDANGRSVNLGGATEVSVNALAQRVVAVLHSRSPIVHVPYEQAYGPGYEDMRRRVPNNGLARRLVGFDPHTSVDDMIRAVAQGHPLAATAAEARRRMQAEGRLEAV